MALVVMSMVLLDWVPAGHAACLSALHESSTTNLASLPHPANKMVGGRLYGNYHISSFSPSPVQTVHTACPSAYVLSMEPANKLFP